MTRTLIIAEAGVNHNGSLDMALKLVEAAALAGADVVKFQTFRADALVTSTSPKAEYQRARTSGAESQRLMLKALELDADAHRSILRACQDLNIEFMSTPFDEDSVRMLAESLGVRRMKVPSGELTNGPLLLSMASTGLPAIVSTGMATLSEVEDALGVLAFGYTGAQTPGSAAFKAAFASPDGKRALLDKVCLLHCTTEYPAPFQDVNLRAMATMAGAFGLPVGFSDHTEGWAVPLAAVALGAKVVEKHLTLDRSLPGPDHAASLEPADFAAMVTGIRAVEASMGSGIKAPAPSEAKNIPIARRSLVAAMPVAKGELFTSANLHARRPGQGVSPMRYWDTLGKRAARDYHAEEAIDE